MNDKHLSFPIIHLLVSFRHVIISLYMSGRLRGLRKFFILCVFITSLGGAAAAKDVLAVLPFTGGEEEEGETIAELFSFAPALNDVFRPILRTSLAQGISDEQKFQMGAMTDPDTIAALNEQDGAKYILTGSIAKLGNRNLLLVSILKIDDLRQIAGDLVIYTSSEEIQDKLPEMARNIVNAIQNASSSLDKLAVLPVEMGSNINARIADTLAQILSLYFIRSGRYAVYPRTGLEQVQREYDTQLALAAEKNVVDMGKGDNPPLVLSVAARRLGARNMFNASIMHLKSGAQEEGTYVNYDTLEDGIEAMGNLAAKLTGVPAGILVPPGIINADTRAKTPRASAGKPFEYGALNLVLGLGSFIQKDWTNGLILFGGYAAAGGLIAWELSLEYEDALAGIPGVIGLGVAGVTAAYGFIRPFIYEKNRALVNQADRIGVLVIPGNRGTVALGLSYTLRF